jgi:hypothetical protein
METHEGVEVYLHHSWSRHQIEVSGRLHVPTALPPGKEVIANLLARDSDYTAGLGWKWIYLTLILLIHDDLLLAASVP